MSPPGSAVAAFGCGHSFTEGTIAAMIDLGQGNLVVATAVCTRMETVKLPRGRCSV